MPIMNTRKRPGDNTVNQDSPAEKKHKPDDNKEPRVEELLSITDQHKKYLKRMLEILETHADAQDGIYNVSGTTMEFKQVIFHTPFFCFNPDDVCEVEIHGTCRVISITAEHRDYACNLFYNDRLDQFLWCDSQDMLYNIPDTVLSSAVDEKIDRRSRAGESCMGNMVHYTNRLVSICYLINSNCYDACGMIVLFDAWLMRGIVELNTVVNEFHALTGSRFFPEVRIYPDSRMIHLHRQEALVESDHNSLLRCHRSNIVRTDTDAMCASAGCLIMKFEKDWKYMCHVRPYREEDTVALVTPLQAEDTEEEDDDDDDDDEDDDDYPTPPAQLPHPDIPVSGSNSSPPPPAA